MKNTSRANTLLVELLLVILFFLFASMTLVELFGVSKRKSIDAQSISDSVMEAQNVAEELYNTSAPEEKLAELGFTADGDHWVVARDNYSLMVTKAEEESEAGVLRMFYVIALEKDQQKACLPAARYWPKEGTP